MRLFSPQAPDEQVWSSAPFDVALLFDAPFDLALKDSCNRLSILQQDVAKLTSRLALLNLQ